MNCTGYLVLIILPCAQYSSEHCHCWNFPFRSRVLWNMGAAQGQGRISLQREVSK
jgi:hypothetical protein